MAESDPESLSEILVSNDLASLLDAALKLARTCKHDNRLCVSLVDDIREAADLYFGREPVKNSLFEVMSVKAVRDLDGSLVTRDFVFSLVEDGAALVRYRGTRSSITVPENVLFEGSAYPVVELSDRVFESTPFLTRVGIPFTIKRIDNKAFSGCAEISCIKIPFDVEHIADDAFDGCDSLEKFEVDRGNGFYASDSQGILYDVREKELVKAPSLLGGVAVIPDKVVSIADSAFYDCIYLKSVIARGSLERIGRWAFEGCTSLESIALGGSLKSIGSGAFYDCSALARAEIPDGVRTIESRTFHGCTGLKKLCLPESLTTIGKWAFELCSSLEYIRIPATVSKIEQGAFYGCDSLQRFEVHPSNTSYSSDEFGILYERKRGALLRSPKALSGSLRIRRGTSIVDERAFEGCRDIDSVELPDTVGYIGKRAFSGCTGLKAFSIPPKVKSIPDSAFTGCSSLSSVAIPESVTKIGCGAFSDCPSLKEVVLPAKLTSFGFGAFDDTVHLLRK